MLSPKQLIVTIHRFNRGVGQVGRTKGYSFLVVTLVSLSTFSMTISIIPDHARAGTLFVGGSGPGNYSVIQTAMDDAQPGDTVFVYSGIYHEQLVFRKPLNLVGEDRDTTFINGSFIGDIINVTVEWASISGFSIESSRFSLGSSGIELWFANHTNISNNIIAHCYDGIAMWFSNFTTFEHNIIYNTSDAIFMKYSQDSTIANNNASHSDLGIYVSMFSHRNKIVNNSATHNYEGIQVSFSHHNYISENSVYSNRQEGFFIMASDYNTIVNNTLGDRQSLYLGATLRNYVAFNKGGYLKSLYSEWCTIYGNDFSSNSGTNMYIEESQWNEISENNVSLSENGYGIWLSNSHNNTIHHNQISWNGYHGISLTGLLNYVHDNVVMGNQDIGISIAGDRNKIENNVISYNTNAGVYSSISHNNTFITNTISNNEAGIVIERGVHHSLTMNTLISNGVVILGHERRNWNSHSIGSSNMVNGKPVYYWKNRTSGTVTPGAGQVILGNCSGVSVSNQIMADSTIGVQIGFSTGIDVVGNVLSYHSRNGASVWYSNFLMFNWNEFSNNSYGVFSYDGHNMTFDDNYLSYNSRGVHSESTMDMTISDNRIAHNSMGMHLERSTGIIARNNITNNVIGAYLKWSSPFFVYHNNFSLNQNQAGDDSINQWDDGYPSGGNWWSDYTGVDNRSGPNQDIPGADGFGDTPYQIAGPPDTKDRYPMNPVPPPPPPENLTTSIYDGDDIRLDWTAPQAPNINYYLIYRSTDPREFDFWDPIHDTSNGPNPRRTWWIDIDAANDTAPVEYYYTVRAVYMPGAESMTSNTAGKWTKHFSAGLNSFSLPFEPFATQNVSWYVNDMVNATRINWMSSSGNWVTHLLGMGDGANDSIVEPGIGYEVHFSSNSTYTFCGQPASMIRFKNRIWDSVDFRKSLVAQQVGSDITLTWDLLPGASEFWIFKSNQRAGLHDSSLQAEAVVPSTQSSWTDVGVLSTEKEIHYMIMPMDSGGNYGSSTYSVGVITLDFALLQTSFGVPLGTQENRNVDWYCDQIPDVAGIAFMISGLWKFHATEMPTGVYDPLAVQAEGYQLSLIDGKPSLTFIGF
jgi:parallel beta-helix repeat protein